MDITEARVVVSGGLGVQGPENFKLLEELANLLGGAVGASRPVVDNGWREYSNQVGQTGSNSFSRPLFCLRYFRGCSAFSGMSSSRCIVAINSDPNAAIFSVADYGIVGDVIKVIPALIREFKKTLIFLTSISSMQRGAILNILKDPRLSLNIENLFC